MEFNQLFKVQSAMNCFFGNLRALNPPDILNVQSIFIAYNSSMSSSKEIQAFFRCIHAIDIGRH